MLDVQALAKLTHKDEIVAALAASFAFGHKAIATLTPANTFEVLKSNEPGLQTRAHYLRLPWLMHLIITGRWWSICA